MSASVRAQKESIGAAVYIEATIDLRSQHFIITTSQAKSAFDFSLSLCWRAIGDTNRLSLSSRCCEKRHPSTRTSLAFATGDQLKMAIGRR